MKKNKKFMEMIVALIFLVGVIIIIISGSISAQSIEKQRENLMDQESRLHKEMLEKGMYTCCLEKPCHTCLSLDPWHGEGASCTCLEDVVNGEAPCGECVGEILAGRGNKYLKPYFADSIAEGIGEEHIEMLNKIVSEKYLETNKKEEK